MRLIVALIVILYLVGVGVVLAPTVQGKWSTVPAPELTASVWDALPNALAWPVRVFHSVTGR